jgi:hypothetical protein
LPDPPTEYANLDLLSAGSSLVLVGAICSDLACSEHEYEFARLEPSLDKWTVLDARPKAAGSEPAISTSRGVNRIGLAHTEAGTFAVTEEGEVTKVPSPNDGVRAMGCVAGTTLVYVETPGADPSAAPAAEPEVALQVRDLSDADATWRPAAAPPPGTSGTAGLVCAASGPLLLNDTSESIFDASTGTWSQQPADAAKAALRGQSLSGGGDDYVVGPDGALYVVGIGMDGIVARRAPDGSWSDTGVRAQGLFATSDMTLGFWPGSFDAKEVS